MPDKQMTEFLSGVVGAVEANSFERLSLWEDYHDRRRVSWQQDAAGLLETIGFLDDRPICLSLVTAVVDGRKILFYDATSQVVDHVAIDRWLAEVLPDTARRPNGTVIKENAMNFHNALRATGTLLAKET